MDYSNPVTCPPMRKCALRHHSDVRDRSWEFLMFPPRPAPARLPRAPGSGPDVRRGPRKRLTVRCSASGIHKRNRWGPVRRGLTSDAWCDQPKGKPDWCRALAHRTRSQSGNLQGCRARARRHQCQVARVENSAHRGASRCRNRGRAGPAGDGRGACSRHGWKTVSQLHQRRARHRRGLS